VKDFWLLMRGTIFYVANGGVTLINEYKYKVGECDYAKSTKDRNRNV
jgi:hypothetical protein